MNIVYQHSRHFAISANGYSMIKQGTKVSSEGEANLALLGLFKGENTPTHSCPSTHNAHTFTHEHTH